MRVIEAFVDITDHNHLYHPGDTFPRKGLKVTSDRIAFLSGSDNLLGKPVIAEDPVVEKPKRGRKKNAD